MPLYSFSHFCQHLHPNPAAAVTHGPDLSKINKFAREAQMIRVERGLNSTDVVETLAAPFFLDSPPRLNRSVNSPEFIA